MVRTKPLAEGKRESKRIDSRGNKSIRARANKALAKRRADAREKNRPNWSALPKRICKLGRRLAKARAFGRSVS